MTGDPFSMPCVAFSMVSDASASVSKNLGSRAACFHSNQVRDLLDAVGGPAACSNRSATASVSTVRLSGRVGQGIGGGENAASRIARRRPALFMALPADVPSRLPVVGVPWHRLYFWRRQVRQLTKAFLVHS
jgi:hypothetical protein